MDEQFWTVLDGTNFITALGVHVEKNSHVM